MKEFLKGWDEHTEASVWKKAIFVFDSSTLLNIYEFLESARKDLYKNVFEKIAGRAWITNHTEYEFLKHKEKKVIGKPKMLYDDIQNKYFPDKSLITHFSSQLAGLKTRTATEGKHPYFEQSIFDDLDKSISVLNNMISDLKKKLGKQISKHLKEHAATIENDKLPDYFQVTPGFTHQELMDIMKEGEFRYKHKLPPGYKDEAGKEELGMAKFGDLIIWKQVIRLAKDRKLPVILVIDDLKEDWCIKDENNNIITPRIELLKEMKDEAGVAFWSYSLPQFLKKANQYLDFTVTNETIKQAEALSLQRVISEDVAIFKWLNRRFKPYDIVWGLDFHIPDTGAYFVKSLGDVTYSINLVEVNSIYSPKEIDAVFRDFETINEKFSFTHNILIWLGKDRETAHGMASYKLDNSYGFISLVGYVNDDYEFIEVSNYTGRLTGSSHS